MAKKNELTPQQEKFALGIAAGKSQADAYREAYPNSKKWKDDSVHNKASALMRNAQVAARVADLRAKVEEKTLVSAARVITEISRISFFDPRKLFNPDGSPKAINELDDDTAAALAGLDVNEEFAGSGEDRVFIGYTKKYKIADKNSGLNMLCRHLGLFKAEGTVPVDDAARAMVEAMNATNTVMLNTLLNQIKNATRSN